MTFCSTVTRTERQHIATVLTDCPLTVEGAGLSLRLAIPQFAGHGSMFPPLSDRLQCAGAKTPNSICSPAWNQVSSLPAGGD